MITKEYENEVVMIQFGKMCVPIEKQLNEQGYTLGEYAYMFQAMMNGMDALYTYHVINREKLNYLIDGCKVQMKKYMKPIKEYEND